MEDQLALRIRLFRETGQARPEVADFVTAELEALSAEGQEVTEESAGMLTSHLITALNRLVDGRPIEQFPTDAQVVEELAAHPEAVRRAREVTARAERRLGAVLPDSEVHFLAMHLAVLAERSARAADAAGGGPAAGDRGAEDGDRGTPGGDRGAGRDRPPADDHAAVDDVSAGGTPPAGPDGPPHPDR